MSKSINQYDSAVDTQSGDYFILQRGTSYKKITKQDFFTTIQNDLATTVTTLRALEDVDTTYLTDGDILQYDSGSDTFVFSSAASLGSTDLAVANKTSTTFDITSSTGADVTLPQATTTEAGLFSATDKTKLNRITVTTNVNLTTMASDISSLQTDVNDLITSVVGVLGISLGDSSLPSFSVYGIVTDSTDVTTALTSIDAYLGDLGTFTGSTISNNQALKPALQDLETALELRHTGSLTSGYIPKANGTLSMTNSIMYDTGSAIALGATSATYYLSFNGDVARDFGMNRHTTSNTAGNNLSIYAGGATSSATNKNGGNLNLYAGIATGTGTSQINFYTSPTGSSGTSDRTQTVKLNITGEGTSEFTTSTSTSKMRIGHGLATILSTSMSIGVQLARTDGTYVVHSGIFAGSDYNTYITYGNGAIRFVRNPASDTSAGLVLGGGSQAGSIWSGVGNTGTYEFHFRRTWNNGGSAVSAYIDATGTNSNAAQSTGGLYINNNIVNSSTGINYALQINTSGHTTTASNIAISVESGRTVLLGTVANYDLSFGENADRTFGVNRETSASTAGWKLSIYGGSATLGGSNLAGGDVEVISGTGTGSSGANIVFKTSTPSASGTSDNTPTTKMTIKGSGVINMSALPTSSSGLSSGDLWNNSGVVNIV